MTDERTCEQGCNGCDDCTDCTDYDDYDDYGEEPECQSFHGDGLVWVLR